MPKKIIRDGKEHVVYDPTNEEDMRIALGTAKKTLEDMEGKTDADAEVEKFKTEAELEEENQQLKEKINLIATEAFESKKRKLGCSDPEITSLDQLEAWQKGQESAKQKPRGFMDSPVGSAPLEGNIRASQGYKEGYGSTEELIDDLRRQSHEGSKEAEKILGKLLEKAVQGVKEGKKGFGEIKTSEDGETELERIRRIFIEKRTTKKQRELIE
jgi:hypothetical protein